MTGTGEPLFVVPAIASTAAMEAPPQPRALALSLRGAATMGDVGAIERLARELRADGRVLLGERIAHLKTAFDFDALVRLADWLESQEDVEGAAD